MPTLVTVTLSDDLNKQLEERAQFNHRSKRSEILVAIERYLRKQEPVRWNPPLISGSSGGFYSQDDAA